MIETDVSDKSPSIFWVSDTENARNPSASADGEVCIHVLDVHLMRVSSRNSASSKETEAPPVQGRDCWVMSVVSWACDAAVVRLQDSSVVMKDESSHCIGAVLKNVKGTEVGCA